MKKKTMSPKEFYIQEAIKAAKLESKSLEDYSAKEIEKITTAFSSDKMLSLRSKFGEKEFTDALNEVFTTQNEEEDFEMEEVEIPEEN